MLSYFLSVPVQHAIRLNVFAEDTFIWVLDHLLLDRLGDLAVFFFEHGEEAMAELIFTIAENTEELLISFYKNTFERYQDFLISLMFKLGWEVEQG